MLVQAPFTWGCVMCYVIRASLPHTGAQVAMFERMVACIRFVNDFIPRSRLFTIPFSFIGNKKERREEAARPET